MSGLLFPRHMYMPMCIEGMSDNSTVSSHLFYSSLIIMGWCKEVYTFHFLEMNILALGNDEVSGNDNTD